jgi:hypothetical protein
MEVILLRFHYSSQLIDKAGSYLLRIALVVFAAAALAHDGLVEAVAEGFGEFVNLVIAVDLDGLLGGVHDHVASVAPMEMLVQFGLQVGIDVAVQIIGQLF